MPVLPVSRPIFANNPLKMLLSNNYSGTTAIQNLTHINKIYEIMRDAVAQENNPQHPHNLNHSFNSGSNIYNNQQSLPINLHGVTNIFQTVKPNKLFMTIKGQKIFNIVKENNQPHVIIIQINLIINLINLVFNSNLFKTQFRIKRMIIKFSRLTGETIP